MDDTPHLETWIDCEHGDWHGANTWNLRGIFVPRRHSRQGPLRRNGWATSRDFHRRFRLFINYIGVKKAGGSRLYSQF